MLSVYIVDRLKYLQSCALQRISNALEFLCDGFLAEFLRTMSDNIRHISAKSKQKIGQKDKHKIFKALEMRCNGSDLYDMRCNHLNIAYKIISSTTR